LIRPVEEGWLLPGEPPAAATVLAGSRRNAAA
jgi:hypothetical protein